VVAHGVGSAVRNFAGSTLTLKQVIRPLQLRKVMGYVVNLSPVLKRRIIAVGGIIVTVRSDGDKQVP
jgi:hypothetical protein